MCLPTTSTSIKCLQAINKPAEVIECTYGRVPLDQLLGIQAFSLDRVLAQEPDFLVSYIVLASIVLVTVLVALL
jgi:G3E family GTPase